RDDLGDRELHHRLGVRTASGTAGRAAGEDVAAEERVEQVVEAEAALAERIARGRARRAEHVVLPAAFGIAQRVVRRVDLLQALGRVRVVGVGVRVALARQLAIRALDLVVGGLARDAEHFVRVATFSHAAATSGPRPRALVITPTGPAVCAWLLM